MDIDKDNRPDPVLHEPTSAYVEQYKLFVQSADNTSGRRVSVNRYQTSLNVGIIALFGITATIGPQPILQIIIAVAGVVISLNWLFTIRSLRRLNIEKFKIIHSMEESLPRAIYTEEWQGLGHEKGWHYRGANFFENQIPPIFTFMHFCAIVYGIYGLVT
jgi:hypothetical protein